MPENTIVPGARPRPSRRKLVISTVAGGLVGFLGAVIAYLTQGGNVWLYLAFIVAGAFVGYSMWNCAPVLSES